MSLPLRRVVVCVLLFCFFSTGKLAAQCIQIESILVDACGPQEGLNEMVRFRVGPTAINTSNLSVDWPNNPWQGLVQNATTAAVTAQLNGDILDAGGCGQLIEPTGGVLPANALVVLATSYNLDVNANQFGPITSDIYIIYQDNQSTVGGHFANFGTGLRTLVISFGACSDTVTYDRSLLVNQSGVPSATNGDGSTVEFNTAGNPTYINNGCAAPVPPFVADAGAPVSGCPGATVSLSGTAENYQSVAWSAPSGSFSSTTTLSTQFTIPADATGTIEVTLTATNACGAEVLDTVIVTVTAPQTPNFTSPITVCQGATAPALATTSPNGITGTWSPATIDNSVSGTYVFTPTTGQCAATFTLQVNVTPPTVPNFTSPIAVCQGSVPPSLPATSPNGVSGTWSPAAIDASVSGTYVFTPAAGQCATTFTLQVNVGATITPDFPLSLTICQGSAAPALATTSPNGITGTWSPSTINNTADGSYVFTPAAGQCSAPVTLQVTVTPLTTPNFTTPLTICQGDAAPALATTSPNGVTGTWAPATIDNSVSGTYVFTPTAGQCAATFTLQVNVTPPTVPNFTSPIVVCQGSVPPTLPATSPNGVSGTWSPSAIDASVSGTYVFTPAAGQCATPFTLQVNVGTTITPDFPSSLTICQGSAAPALATTSPNGITGTWSPSTINNTADGSYVFTPAAGQCSAPVTLQVAVTPLTTPNFTTPLTICQGDAAPALDTTSPNGITGTWSPATIDNSASGTYVFTPTAGQCATTFTLQVNVTPPTVPNFTSPISVCQGSVPPSLLATSPNGVSGTWSPAAIDASVSGTYVFTPAAGQCATPFTLQVNVTAPIAPDFASPVVVCQGSVPPSLLTTSPNGISGTWSPSVIDTSAGGSYVFTPASGQCAVPFTLQVNVDTSVTPDFASSLTICQGDAVPVLPSTSPNGISGSWSPAVIDNNTSGTYLFTPNAGQCAPAVTLQVTVTPSVSSGFTSPITLCQGDAAPNLNTTSPTGVTGSWSPSAIDTNTSGTYVFTPDAGQCAVPFTLQVVVNPIQTPNFTTPLTVCQGTAAPVLASVSPNGITGSWSPALIDTSTSAAYVFTPDAGQCATSFTLQVDVTPTIAPDFTPTLGLCQGAAAPVLAPTSPNGIVGTWSPAAINTNASGNYVFTPSAGQCATPFTLQVTITPTLVPNFTSPVTICEGTVAPVLSTISPNGVSGTWTPDVVSNTVTGTYVFVPNAGQCAAPFTLQVNVTPQSTPDFDTELTLCNGETPPVLATLSPNGISGTWSPATIDATLSGTYTFTPDAGQCATPTTLEVTVGTISVSISEGCDGLQYILTSALPEGIDPDTVTYTWRNGGAVVGADATLNVTELAAGSNLSFPTSFDLTVTTTEGCTNSQSFPVAGIICGIPRGISPNGDGKNDVFDLNGFGVAHITIFNRYGVEVFSRHNYTNEWDGHTNDGQELPSATYFYVIDRTDGKNFSGWVYINR